MPNTEILQPRNSPLQLPEIPAGLFLFGIEKLGLHVTCEGLEYSIEAYNRLLAGDSLLVYFGPHRHTFDPIAVTKALSQHLWLSHIKNADLGWIAAAGYSDHNLYPSLDGFGRFNTFSHASMGWAKFRNLFWLPVVQPHYYENLTPEEKDLASVRNKNAMFSAIAFLKTNSHLLQVSPEGHRNRDNYGLLRADPGFDLIFLRAQKDVFPIIINRISERHYHVRFCPIIPFKEAKQLRDHFQWPEDVIIREGWKDNPRKEGFNHADALMLHLVRIGLEPQHPDHSPAGVYEPLIPQLEHLLARGAVAL
jgi:hypothetical protein